MSAGWRACSQRQLAALAATVSLAAFGCQSADEPAPGPPRARTIAPAAAERLVQLDVRWPGADARTRQIASQLSESARRELDRAGVPVLLPLDVVDESPAAEALLPRAVLVGRPHFATAQLRSPAFEATLEARAQGQPEPEDGGYSVFIQGTRLAHRYEGVEPAKGPETVRGGPAFVTENEGIWSVTFEEHGVSYVVELECARPSDARCSGPELLLAITESLAFAGGREVRIDRSPQ